MMSVRQHLQADCNTIPARRRHARRIGGIFGVLLAILLGAEIPEVHDHAASTPGLYNEECPLARLAVPSWGLQVLAADILARPEPAPAPAAAPAPDQPATPRTGFAARAPPTS